MLLNKKILVLIVLTVSFFGSVFYSGSAQALTIAEAKKICDLKIDTKTVTSCKTAVDKCAPSNQTCITTAVRKGQGVIKECNDQPDPQACQAKYTSLCGNKEAADVAVCKSDFVNSYVNKPNTSDPGIKIGKEGQHQCGDVDVIKTKINLGCTGKGPAILDLTYAIVRFLSIGVGLLAVMSVIYAGVMYASSGGNPETTQQAKARIRNTIIALVFYALIFAMIQFLVPGGLFKG